ncbi:MULTISPECIES: hypothetical protein [Actinoalloteichus]|uniref:hypothetical protein n=1 Tax=Actinoalloteichus TaxID=65496 RepID=UPI0012FB1315|nr:MULTISPECIES: hypothetical protein [Actinoalloteichus]
MGSALELAWRLRWSAPEVTLLAGERARRLATEEGDHRSRLSAELMALFALNRLGRGVVVVERGIAALREVEVERFTELSAPLRVELAHSARIVGAPLIAFGLLRPVLEDDGLASDVRAAGLLELAECLPGGSRDEGWSQALSAADRLYESDAALHPDDVLLRQAMIQALRAGFHRRRGEPGRSEQCVLHGLDLLDGVRGAAADSGQAHARLMLERAHLLLDGGRTDLAVDVCRATLDRPVRAASASAVGWLRVVLATRLHLPAGRPETARELLLEAAAGARRHGLDPLLSESLQALSYLYEAVDELPEALRCLRAAHAAEQRRQRAVSAARLQLAAEFSSSFGDAAALKATLTGLLRPDAESGPVIDSSYTATSSPVPGSAETADGAEAQPGGASVAWRIDDSAGDARGQAVAPGGEPIRAAFTLPPGVAVRDAADQDRAALSAPRGRHGATDSHTAATLGAGGERDAEDLPPPGGPARESASPSLPDWRVRADQGDPAVVDSIDGGSGVTGWAAAPPRTSDEPRTAADDFSSRRPDDAGGESHAQEFVASIPSAEPAAAQPQAAEPADRHVPALPSNWQVGAPAATEQAWHVTAESFDGPAPSTPMTEASAGRTAAVPADVGPADVGPAGEAPADQRPADTVFTGSTEVSAGQMDARRSDADAPPPGTFVEPGAGSESGSSAPSAPRDQVRSSADISRRGDTSAETSDRAAAASAPAVSELVHPAPPIGFEGNSGVVSGREPVGEAVASAGVQSELAAAGGTGPAFGVERAAGQATSGRQAGFDPPATPSVVSRRSDRHDEEQTSGPLGATFAAEPLPSRRAAAGGGELPVAADHRSESAPSWAAEPAPAAGGPVSWAARPGEQPTPPQGMPVSGAPAVSGLPDDAALANEITAPLPVIRDDTPPTSGDTLPSFSLSELAAMGGEIDLAPSSLALFRGIGTTDPLLAYERADDEDQEPADPVPPMPFGMFGVGVPMPSPPRPEPAEQPAATHPASGDSASREPEYQDPTARAPAAQHPAVTGPVDDPTDHAPTAPPAPAPGAEADVHSVQDLPPPVQERGGGADHARAKGADVGAASSFGAEPSTTPPTETSPGFESPEPTRPTGDPLDVAVMTDGPRTAAGGAPPSPASHRAQAVEPEGASPPSGPVDPAVFDAAASASHDDDADGRTPETGSAGTAIGTSGGAGDAAAAAEWRSGGRSANSGRRAHAAEATAAPEWERALPLDVASARSDRGETTTPDQPAFRGDPASARAETLAASESPTPPAGIPVRPAREPGVGLSLSSSPATSFPWAVGGPAVPPRNVGSTTAEQEGSPASAGGDRSAISSDVGGVDSSTSVGAVRPGPSDPAAAATGAADPDLGVSPPPRVTPDAADLSAASTPGGASGSDAVPGFELRGSRDAVARDDVPATAAGSASGPQIPGPAAESSPAETDRVPAGSTPTPWTGADFSDAPTEPIPRIAASASGYESVDPGEPRTPPLGIALGRPGQGTGAPAVEFEAGRATPDGESPQAANSGAVSPHAVPVPEPTTPETSVPRAESSPAEPWQAVATSGAATPQEALPQEAPPPAHSPSVSHSESTPSETPPPVPDQAEYGDLPAAGTPEQATSVPEPIVSRSAAGDDVTSTGRLRRVRSPLRIGDLLADAMMEYESSLRGLELPVPPPAPRVGESGQPPQAARDSGGVPGESGTPPRQRSGDGVPPGANQLGAAAFVDNARPQSEVAGRETGSQTPSSVASEQAGGDWAVLPPRRGPESDVVADSEDDQVWTPPGD